MKLERIRIEFDPEQDRLLMHVLIDGSAEVQLWLTRRCVSRFWTAMVRMAETKPEVSLQLDPGARSAVLQFEHEKALQQVRFSAPDRESPGEPPRAHPLGPEPLLVTRIQARRESDQRTLLALLPSRGQGAHLTLTESLLHGLMRLVQQAVARADWGLVLELPAATGADEGTRVLN